jgi:hypothetical protein
MPQAKPQQYNNAAKRTVSRMGCSAVPFRHRSPRNVAKRVKLSGLAHRIADSMRASGGCFQWVLDTACQAVEWPSQPLGFNSLTLRKGPRSKIRVDIRAAALIIKADRRLSSIYLKLRLTTGAFCLGGLPIPSRPEWTRPRLRLHRPSFFSMAGRHEPQFHFY